MGDRFREMLRELDDEKNTLTAEVMLEESLGRDEELRDLHFRILEERVTRKLMELLTANRGREFIIELRPRHWRIEKLYEGITVTYLRVQATVRRAK